MEPKQSQRGHKSYRTEYESQGTVQISWNQKPKARGQHRGLTLKDTMCWCYVMMVSHTLEMTPSHSPLVLFFLQVERVAEVHRPDPATHKKACWVTWTFLKCSFAAHCRCFSEYMRLTTYCDTAQFCCSVRTACNPQQFNFSTKLSAQTNSKILQVPRSLVTSSALSRYNWSSKSHQTLRDNKRSVLQTQSWQIKE